MYSISNIKLYSHISTNTSVNYSFCYTISSSFAILNHLLKKMRYDSLVLLQIMLRQMCPLEFLFSHVIIVFWCMRLRHFRGGVVSIKERIWKLTRALPFFYRLRALNVGNREYIADLAEQIRRKRDRALVSAIWSMMIARRRNANSEQD